MTYYDQWIALSCRIRGLMEAAQLHARFLTIRSGDTYQVGARLHEQSEDILSELQIFEERFRRTLPPGALASIDNFRDRFHSLISNTGGGPGARQERVWAVLVLTTACSARYSNAGNKCRLGNADHAGLPGA